MGFANDFTSRHKSEFWNWVDGLMLGSGRGHITDGLQNARTLRETGLVFMTEHKCGRVSE
jgi:hypothetical protein